MSNSADQVWSDLASIVDQNKNSPVLKIASSSRSTSTSTASPSSSSTCSPLGPRFGVSGTTSRQKLYLLDQFPCSDLPKTKLPKISYVMRIFFGFLLDQEDLKKHSNPLTLATKSAVLKAAKDTASAVKEVWRHHFGIRLIDGKESVTSEVDSSKIMVTGDKYIAEKVMNLFSEWQAAEKLSRRQDRVALLVKKEASFRAKLDHPFNILKPKGEEILCHSGIIDWKEELQHLRNQLTPEQPGSCDGYDMRQKKRDQRKLKEMDSMQLKRQLSENKKSEQEKSKENCEKVVEEYVDEIEDEDFIEPKVRKKKIDVMGPISRTADARGISMRDRTALAASVANTIGVDLADTNISIHSAWKQAKSHRLRLAEKVKEDFVCPPRVSLHWDGKTLTMKGNKKSGRVCVYLSAIDASKVKKLIAVPETKSGTGKAESEVVLKELKDWDIKEQVVSLVFDTTASNTSGEVGACHYLELYVDSPVLWTACRHHVYELHIKKVTEVVTGQTKDPGVEIFRRLKSQWYSLVIDYDNLELFDYEAAPDWMSAEARSVLEWGEEHLIKVTWPREDYREFLMLVVVSLGGTIPNFKFRLPGPDHHARWMSKGIYVMKIWLLSKIFKLSDAEKSNIMRIFNFTVVIYAKAWLTSALPTSAARNDLTFHYNVLRYRKVEPSVAFRVLQSIQNHMWYTTGQLVVLALADPELEAEEKEELAKTLHREPRVKVKMGKPEYPVLDWRNTVLTRPRLASLVTCNSWLIFDLLGLTGPQDWLQLTSNMWDMFSEYRRFAEFATNLPVTNDLAERGIHLISEFINKSADENQRQALLQVVEYHRALVPDLNKNNLSKC